MNVKNGTFSQGYWICVVGVYFIFVWVRVMKTNLMHCLSSIYFVNQPLHVSGVSVAHHQEVYCIYIYIQKLVLLCFLVDCLLSDLR